MTEGLNRYQQAGDFHFVTFSCYQRKPYLNSPKAKTLFLQSLERARQKYQFSMLGYVVMPEHVHLLVTEPAEATLAKVLMAIKISSAKQLNPSPFWQARYYDFNVFTHTKQVEKLRYIHRNPVQRGLVAKPEDWPWSSFRHYMTGEEGAVQIESFRSAFLRDQASLKAKSLRDNKEQ